MTIVVPNTGEAIALEYLVNKDAPENLVLRLFVNNITPAETDTAVTYTECAEAGYAAITLTGASWNTTPGAPSDVTYNAQQTFTFTGTPPTGQTIYGYYYTRLTSADLVAAELAGTPFTVANTNDTVKITPSITAT